jgi:hypothetical protein
VIVPLYGLRRAVWQRGRPARFFGGRWPLRRPLLSRRGLVARTGDRARPRLRPCALKAGFDAADEPRSWCYCCVVAETGGGVRQQVTARCSSTHASSSDRLSSSWLAAYRTIMVPMVVSWRPRRRWKTPTSSRIQPSIDLCITKSDALDHAFQSQCQIRAISLVPTLPFPTQLKWLGLDRYIALATAPSVRTIHLCFVFPSQSESIHHHAGSHV